MAAARQSDWRELAAAEEALLDGGPGARTSDAMRRFLHLVRWRSRAKQRALLCMIMQRKCACLRRCAACLRRAVLTRQRLVSHLAPRRHASTPAAARRWWRPWARSCCAPRGCRKTSVRSRPAAPLLFGATLRLWRRALIRPAPAGWTVHEQVVVAACDAGLHDLAATSLAALEERFPGSQRVGALRLFLRLRSPPHSRVRNRLTRAPHRPVFVQRGCAAWCLRPAGSGRRRTQCTT